MEFDTTNDNKQTIILEKASHDFGGGAGVFDIDLSLKSGSILGIIGPSGCGKTTMIRMVNGLLGTTAGEVRVFDKDPTKFNAPEKTRIGYIPQHFILYDNLNVEENMHFVGGIFGMTNRERKEKIQPLLEFVDLVDARKRLARKLSGGMQRRLMLAGALLHTPDILIADEPTAGIDPILRARIWENFRALRDQGKTLLVTTQYVGEAAFCDQVAVMRQGRLLIVDTPEGLQHQAMGGEVIHLQVKDQLLESIQFLEDLSAVQRVDMAPGETDGLFVFVENASENLPYILSKLKEEIGVTPSIAEPYLPPFDEVFVRLIQNFESLETMEMIK